jgi:hypothetical protein
VSSCVCFTVDWTRLREYPHQYVNILYWLREYPHQYVNIIYWLREYPHQYVNILYWLREYPHQYINIIYWLREYPHQYINIIYWLREYPHQYVNIIYCSFPVWSSCKGLAFYSHVERSVMNASLCLLIGVVWAHETSLTLPLL